MSLSKLVGSLTVLAVTMYVGGAVLLAAPEDSSGGNRRWRCHSHSGGGGEVGQKPDCDGTTYTIYCDKKKGGECNFGNGFEAYKSGRNDDPTWFAVVGKTWTTCEGAKFPNCVPKTFVEPKISCNVQEPLPPQRASGAGG